MASEEIVGQLNGIIADCLSWPINKLLSNPAWGAISFEGARNDLDRAFEILGSFQKFPIKNLPTSVALEIIQEMERIQAAIHEIRNFSLASEGAPSQRRDWILRNLNEAVNDFFIKPEVWVPHFLYIKGGLKKNTDEFSKFLANVQNKAAEVLRETGEKQDEIEGKKKEIDRIVAAAKEAASSVGVEIYTADFSKEADSLEKRAQCWLWTGVGFLSLTVIFAWIFISADVMDVQNMAALFQVTTSKFILLGLFFSATFWCGRNYRALMHQASINRHRANALKTFQTFNKSASDEDSKKAILLETTKAIFRVTSTGYLDKEPPTGQE